MDPSGESPVHGFVWDDGRYTTFDIRGSISTAAYEINNRGQIVGNYVDADGAEHGFVRDKGKVTTIDHPDASDDPAQTGTRVVGINDRGQLVGSYGDGSGSIRAWMWRAGTFTTIHPRFAAASEASTIDNRGRVVGRYLDSKLSSFLYSRGRYTRIDLPNRCDTAAIGLNDRGQILVATAGATCPPQDGNR